MGWVDRKSWEPTLTVREGTGGSAVQNQGIVDSGGLTTQAEAFSSLFRKDIGQVRSKER